MLSNVFNLSILIIGSITALVLFLLIWNKPVLVIYIQLIYCCFMRFFIWHLHFPDVIKLFSDFLTVILSLQVILNFNKTKTLNIRKPLFFIILFFISATFSSIISGSSISFYLFGLRTYYKLFIYFLACTIFLKREDLDKLMKFLLMILPIDTLVVLFQYFILGLEDDYIGGLFGTVQGCNGESNIYLTITCIIAITFYVSKKIKLWYCNIIILQCCMIAAISELKILFFTLALILMVVFIFNYSNKRAIIILVSSFFFLSIGIFAFLIIYPGWITMFTDFGSFLRETAAGTYGSSNTLGRTIAGPYVLQNILMEPVQKIFGVGLGYGDRYLSMKSNFFARYESLSFNLFAYVIIIIEVGILGLILFCLIFASILYESMRVINKIEKEKKIYCCISFIVSIQVFLQILYDQAIFWDGAYILFFSLSFPFIMEKEYNEKLLLTART